MSNTFLHAKSPSKAKANKLEWVPVVDPVSFSEPICEIQVGGSRDRKQQNYHVAHAELWGLVKEEEGHFETRPRTGAKDRIKADLLAVHFDWATKRVQRELKAERQRSAIFAINSARFTESLTSITRLTNFNDGWSAPDSLAPSKLAIGKAVDLLSALHTAKLEALSPFPAPWHTAPIPDGGVLLEWRKLRRAIDVEIYADGQVNLLVEHDGEIVLESDEETGVSILEVIHHLVEIGL